MPQPLLETSFVTILLIDTALQRCSVSLVTGGQQAFCEQLDMAKGHAEHLAPLVQKACDATGIKLGEIDRVGVIIGPGGFTGVRVGLAFARGLALGTAIKLVGLSTTHALALTAASAHASNPAHSPGPSSGPSSGPDYTLISVIDARRDEVFCGVYSHPANKPANEGACGLRDMAAPFVSTPEDLLHRLIMGHRNGPCLFVGTGVALLKDEALKASYQWPNDWIDTGIEQIDLTSLIHTVRLARPPETLPIPLYLRAPDAKPSAQSLFAHAAASLTKDQ